MKNLKFNGVNKIFTVILIVLVAINIIFVSRSQAKKVTFNEKEMFQIRRQAFMNGWESQISPSFTCINDEYEFDSIIFIRFELPVIIKKFGF